MMDIGFHVVTVAIGVSNVPTGVSSHDLLVAEKVGLRRQRRNFSHSPFNRDGWNSFFGWRNDQDQFHLSDVGRGRRWSWNLRLVVNNPSSHLSGSGFTEHCHSSHRK